MDAVAAMDADVASIETARSRMELLEAFAAASYPNEIGPGVWDIHSPRVPGADEMAGLLRRAMERRDQLDTERAHSPLRAASDAVALDTTGLPIDQVIDRALELARAAAAHAMRS